ncbi:uncharacterized protein LOC144328012 isoform X2 [Podarcis muralis]
MFSGAAYSQIISRSVLTLGAQGIFVEGVVQQPHSEGRRRAVTRKRSSKQALLIDFLGDLAQASSPPHASVSSAGKLDLHSPLLLWCDAPFCGWLQVSKFLLPTQSVLKQNGSEHELWTRSPHCVYWPLVLKAPEPSKSFTPQAFSCHGSLFAAALQNSVTSLSWL